MAPLQALPPTAEAPEQYEPLTPRGRTGLRILGLLAVAGLIILGIKLRIDQLPYHQNVWGIDWLGYYEPQGRALRHANVFLWSMSWEGLHPPLSGAIHGLLMVAGAGFHVHWTATVAASLAAPLLIASAGARNYGPVAAILVLAWTVAAPIQANYGLNTSPYPWMLLAIAGSTALLLRALEGDQERAWWASAWVSALAVQVHILAFAAVLGQVLFLAIAKGPRAFRAERSLRRWALVVAGSAAIVVIMSLTKTTDPWTFHIESEAHWSETVWFVLVNRFTPLEASHYLWGLLGFGVVGGLIRGPRAPILLLLIQLGGILAALALFYELHVADPRLSHYFIGPQLLAVGAGAWGLASLTRGRVWLKKEPGLWAVALALGLAAAASVPWVTAAEAWYAERSSSAESRIEASAAEELRGLWADAGEGDVVVYLWDHTFLNDEPGLRGTMTDHLDPIAALWPTSRTGRPCFDIEDPRLLCNRHRGAHFFFSPNALTRDPLDAVEETLRLVINEAHPPGRARVVVVPNPGESAPRPWPWEDWLRFQGATEPARYAGEVAVFEFAPGVTIPEPPPIHPGEPPPEDPQ